MVSYQAHSRVLDRSIVFVLIALLTVTVLTAFPAPARADEYPGQDEIAAARAAVDDAAASVAQLDAAIASLEDALHQADIAARIADEDFVIAQEDSVAAQRHLYAANNRADEAEQALTDAKAGLAAVAMASYRNAGSMASVEAIVKADGFEDVVTRSEGLARASATADSTVQKVHAAEIVATTTRAYAEESAVKAQAAEEAAQEALETAQAAHAAAQQSVDDAADARSAAVTRLAQMRGVTEELERQRQEGLAQERAARQRAAFEQQQRELDNSGGNQAGTSPAPGGSPAPTNPSNPTPTQPAPEPEPTTDPAPENPAPQPDPKPEPKPDPKPDPKPNPTWRSTASQGVTAANHSLTMVGAPYLLGGNGPAYDCSGITFAAWKKAGITLPRSSSTQYGAVTHLPYSQLRKGDLVFFSRNGAQSGIYHVAIYIGNGQLMEARRPGVPARTRDMYEWGVANLMPYIGRP